MTTKNLYFKRSGFIDSSWDLVGDGQVLGRIEINFWGNRCTIQTQGNSFFIKRSWFGGMCNIFDKVHLIGTAVQGIKAIINSQTYELRHDELGQGWFEGNKKIIAIQSNDFFINEPGPNNVLLIFLTKFFALPYGGS